MFIVIAHWNNSPTRTHYPDSEPTSLFLLNAACVAEKQPIPFSYSLVLPHRGSNPRSTTLKASAQAITPPMRFFRIELYQHNWLNNQWENLQRFVSTQNIFLVHDLSPDAFLTRITRRVPPVEQELPKLRFLVELVFLNL